MLNPIMEDIKRENICKQIFSSYKNLYPSLQKYIRKEFRDNLLTQIVSDFYQTVTGGDFLSERQKALVESIFEEIGRSRQ